MAGEKFERLVEIMATLRGENGCDWDKAQTHESLKPYLIEEAYEVLNAIDLKDDEELKEELGDVLLQVVFHSQIAKERGVFNIDDVIDTLNDKLVRRHPHVFGDAQGYSYARWEEIKAKEKGEKKRTSIGDVNHALPGLSLARRVQENAAGVGFDWTKIEDVWNKVHEEIDELKNAKSPEEVEEEVGDLLFAIVNLSRFLNVDPETAIRKATEKFISRFEKMEKLIEMDNKKVEELNLEELDEYWNKVKENR
ncbi:MULTISPECIES: nucleoside triphosphate pyrophosphohydrolase [Fervidobacterium]|uniref:MazG family protein n=1 Tax=Fervidobacterium nodosum (strain ATCC 35602 / DSM 5306 / Rt17-B1) TaxID=381764 RepID=A7HLT2_FERNB|nr:MULTISPECIES: nucleoside triphosphate pyrophosphohydrolase [Fervidobacterium]ABS60865.1 MazG family protein [Fervidobacterium nodosum Rt17-B1]KAF2962058.1 pyrophosphatase [Fervidobacterium sp. 2310opik-2]PHJ13570.1 pyrophosphatase [Fervidobacterium sp. SC_NGM5_G05]